MTVLLPPEKIEDQEQADGSRHIGFRFTFHNGLVIDKRFLAASDYNDAVGILDMIPLVEQQVADNEDEQIFANVENGADPVTAIPIHPETDTNQNRQKRWLRKLIRWAMVNREIKWVRLVLYPVWYEFKFNLSYTPAQIQNILDITPAQYNKFNDRLTAIHNNLSDIDADDSYVGEIE